MPNITRALGDVGGRGFAGVIGFSRRTEGGLLAFVAGGGGEWLEGAGGSTFVITM